MLKIENAGALCESRQTLKGENMPDVKIKMTRATMVAGMARAVGETITASEKDARYLMAIGKAVPAEKQTREKVEKTEKTEKVEKTEKTEK